MRLERLSDWLSWQERLHPDAIDLSLDRLRRTLQRLGFGSLRCPVITVGGTNGKGSCVALLNRILSEAGYRVGTFTSPHLLRYNERITIAEQTVSDMSLMMAFERIAAARGADTLTFFEFNTLAALLVFQSAAVDVVVLEVGMGGRLDATNVIDADAAVVTSIALDHCAWLGHDLEAIGAEKAGIFRAGRPAVFGAREMPAAIGTSAKHVGAQLQRLGVDFDFQSTQATWTWHARGARFEHLPLPALVGAIQLENAAAVLAVLHNLRHVLPVPRAALERGLRTVRLDGRFQVITAEHEWILDVAHNPAAARTLATQLRDRPAAGRSIAVCGMLGDKDVAGVAAELRGSFALWIAVELDSPRAVPAATLAQRLSAGGVNVAATAAGVAEACDIALRTAQREDRVVVFGSFLTVGPALAWHELRGSMAPRLY